MTIKFIEIKRKREKKVNELDFGLGNLFINFLFADSVLSFCLNSQSIIDTRQDKKKKTFLFLEIIIIVRN